MKTIKSVLVLIMLLLGSISFGQPPGGGRGHQGHPPVPNDKQIEKMVDEFECLDKSYALMYSNLYEINEKGELLEKTTLERIGKDLQNMPEGHVFLKELESNFIMTPSVLYRTEAIKEVGGYNTDVFFEDYDLFLRLTRKFKISYFREPTVFYRNLISYWHIYKQEIDQELKKKIKHRIRRQTIQLYYIKHKNITFWLKKYLGLTKDMRLWVLYFMQISKLGYMYDKFLSYAKTGIRRALLNDGK